MYHKKLLVVSYVEDSQKTEFEDQYNKQAVQNPVIYVKREKAAFDPSVSGYNPNNLDVVSIDLD